MFIRNTDVGLRFKYRLFVENYNFGEPNPTYKINFFTEITVIGALYMWFPTLRG